MFDYKNQFEIWSNDIYDELNKYREKRCKNEKFIFSSKNIYIIKSCKNVYCNKLHYNGHPEIAEFKNSSTIEINNYSLNQRINYINNLNLSNKNIDKLLKLYQLDKILLCNESLIICKTLEIVKELSINNINQNKLSLNILNIN